MHIPLQRTGDSLTSPPVYGAHAVVLGASIGGLLAARVLSEHFAQVTVVERDRLPNDGRPRRGVPQGRHAHLLLAPGARALEELFPGLLAEVVEAGAPVTRSLDQLHLEVNGHVFCQQPGSRLGCEETGGAVYAPSRPLLESRILRRVRARRNVEIMDGCDVEGLTANSTLTRVTGARVEPRLVGLVQRDLPADLVVAATGRGSRVPSWLRRLGYVPPFEEELPVALTYATQRVRLRPGSVDPLRLVAIGATAGRPTGAAALAQEDDTWVVTLFGYSGFRPPLVRNGWLAFADAVLPRDFCRALRRAEPLTEVQQVRFPVNVWCRYDKLSRFPDGLVVMGDALCTLNPVYGQGMTLAALEALALRDVLRSGTDDVGRRFFDAAVKPIGEAWAFAVGGDLGMPPSIVPGRRPFRLKAMHGYIAQAHAAAEEDPVMAWRILERMGFAESGESLFTPDSLRRVALDRRARRRTEVAAAARMWQVWP